jgi:hypothetical protein
MILRRPRAWIITGVALVGLVAVALAVLPTIARRVAVAQIRAAIGRDVAINDLRLNLFTRQLSLGGFRIAEREGPAAFVELERLDVRFRLWPLVRGRLHLDTIALQKPRVRLARVGNELSIADILARLQAGPAEKKKDPLHVTLGQVTLTDGGAVFDDRSVSPAQAWEIGGLRVELHDLATIGADANGRATVAFQVGGAPVTVTAEKIRLQPAQARAVVTVRGLDLTPFWGYVMTGGSIRPERGRFETRLALEYDGAAGLRVGGNVTVKDIALMRQGESIPLMSTPTLAMTSRDIVYRDGAVTAGRLEVSGAPTIVDTSVTPPRRLELRSLKMSIEDFAWPPRGTARTALAAELPDAGTLTVTGTADLETRAVDLVVEARDVALAAYQRFLPVTAPVVGRAVASLRVKAVVTELPRVAVTGTASASRLTIGPGNRPPVSVERVEIVELDADWPTRVRVGRVTIRKPSLLLEREKDGSFPLRAMLVPAPATSTQKPEAPAAPAASPAPGGAPTTPGAAPPRIVLEITDLAIADGDARFLDRTTTPFYSEQIGRLALAVKNLRNAPDARADLAVQGIVGAAAAVDLRGQIAPFGEPFYLDVTGELRDFAIPRANPYLRHFIDWIAGSGRLSTKVHYRVVGDQLEASNEIVVERLNVERAATAQADKKIGIPLGLAVAIMKDTRGDIRLSVPVGGRLSAPEFSFGEAIATVVKNVMAKIVTAPFRAIGKIFQTDETVEAVAINPVVFEPGSAALTADTQKQLERVADFLRASPQVTLTLQPILSERDLAALRAGGATARIQRVQREEKLAELAEAAVRVFKATFPERPVPKATDEIVASLAERESVSEDERRALTSRRLEVTRKVLVEEAGVETDRLVAAPTAPAAATGERRGEGRIEFDLKPS